MVENLFYQVVRKLEGMGETDHKAVFIDGTKLESQAGGTPSFGGRSWKSSWPVSRKRTGR